jgi:hypothetical protein
VQEGCERDRFAATGLWDGRYRGDIAAVVHASDQGVEAIQGAMLDHARGRQAHAKAVLHLCLNMHEPH